MTTVCFLRRDPVDGVIRQDKQELNENFYDAIRTLITTDDSVILAYLQDPMTGFFIGFGPNWTSITTGPTKT